MYTRSKYKSENPSKTISQIQHILQSLNIAVKVDFESNFGYDFSCRLSICNGGLEFFNLGSNGKGMSEEYALASAYAELLERLQNKALLKENIVYATRYFLQFHNYEFKNFPVLDFLYYPDETIRLLTKDDIINDVVPNFFPSCKYLSLTSNNLYPCIFAPFEDLIDKSLKMIPVEYFRAMCGTTGMCAGNTKEEAITQGINEIFERYVLMKLYTTSVDLPNIELSSFEGHEIYDRIKSLEDKFKVIIKDCSLGIGIPVIGLLLVNQKEGTYAFRLGADYNIITALERCFTESFQGKNSAQLIFNRFDTNNPIDKREYRNSLKNGQGRYPHSVLTHSSSQSQFPHHDFKSYVEELDYYIDYIKSLGTHLYIKDNSFLGFPSFAIYIPNYSIIDDQLFDFSKMIEDKRRAYGKKNSLLNIAESINCSPNGLLANLEDSNFAVLQKWNTAKSSKINSKILGMYVYLSKNNYLEAKKIIENIYKDNRAPVELRCAYDIISLIEDKKDLKSLYLLYGTQMVEEFVQRMDNVIDYLNHQPFSTCFNCLNCPILSTCKFKEILIFEKKIQTLQKHSAGIYHNRS